MSVFIETQKVTKTFGKALSGTARIANFFGANIKQNKVHALSEIDLSVSRGEVVGLVGESGCGKSTLGRIVAGISKPTDGGVLYCGQNLDALKGKERIAAKLAIQMIFQDPMSSLNPRMTVRDIIMGAPLYHGTVSPYGADAYLAHIMQLVGLDATYGARYPHQFSGGQRARIGIARALAVRPSMLVCDESVAALDVSIQAQILNLFMDLRKDLNLTYLFISHDLGVVRHIADRVAIMYLGKIVEAGATKGIFNAPKHPYTVALLEGAPVISTKKRKFHPVKGEIPSPLNPPSGCHFHPRCPMAGPRCKVEMPELRMTSTYEQVRCHLLDGGVQ